MTEEIEERYFENIPNITCIMRTTMALEHKHTAAAWIRNYQEELARDELGRSGLD